MIPRYKDKTCELCGKAFTPKGGVAKYCKSPVDQTCIVCGNIFTSICHPKASTVCDNPNCKKQAGFVAANNSVHRTCRVCGEPFNANSSRQLDCGKEIIKVCEICGNQYKSKCGLRWQEHTCDNPKCKAEYAHKGQQAHYLSTTKTCIWCRKEFHPVNNKQLLCGDSHKVICKVCGKEFEVESTYMPDTAPKYCSDKCKLSNFILKNPMHNPECVEKMKQTKITRYGTDYGSQAFAKGRMTYQQKTGYPHQIYNIETHYRRAETRSKIAANDGKKFDSNYECQVYNFLLDIEDIHIETQVPIEFQYNNTSHSTWIDFKINNMLIEVKGEHLLSGVYDTIGIPIGIKLDAYNRNNVAIIVNNTKNVKDILDKYSNIIGIDIDLFDNTLSKQNKINRWQKIQLSLTQKIKFIEENTLLDI